MVDMMTRYDVFCKVVETGSFTLTAEKLGLKKALDNHGALGHVYVLLAVLLGFVLFNADSLGQAAQDIAGMFAFGKLPLFSAEAVYYLRSYGVVLLLAVIGATPLPKRVIAALSENRKLTRSWNVLEPLLLTGLLLVVTAYLVDGSFNPFLYFRF